MAGKTKSKYFRVAVEGDTTDGRKINRSDIEQMAASFNPTVYGARVWLEHMRGYLPDSPFRAYGDVTSVKAEEIADGELKGKLALFAEIEPTADLIALNKAKQKVYTSIEIQPDFPAVGGAYLVGLAVTDSPASLGTEMLAFSAAAAVNPLAARKQAPENLFTAAVENTLEFEDVEEKPGLFARISELLKGSQNKTKAEFSDVTKAVEAVAGAVVEESTAREQFTAKTENRLAQLEQQLNQQKTEFTQLKASLDGSPAGHDLPPATGGNANIILTDC